MGKLNVGCRRIVLLRKIFSAARTMLSYICAKRVRNHLKHLFLDFFTPVMVLMAYVLFMPASSIPGTMYVNCALTLFALALRSLIRSSRLFIQLMQTLVCPLASSGA